LRLWILVLLFFLFIWRIGVFVVFNL